MVGFDQLSPALINILNEIVKNDNLVKYLYYNDKSPIIQPKIINSSELLFKNLLPYPFDTTIEDQEMSQLRVFFGSGKLHSNMVINDSTLVFDVIVSKKYWLINDGNGTSQIRPYMIMTELEKQFRKQSVQYVGELLFKSFNHIAVDDTFDGMRLLAQATQFSKGY